VIKREKHHHHQQQQQELHHTMALKGASCYVVIPGSLDALLAAKFPPINR